MPYIKTVWQDKAVQYPNRYDKTGETASQVTLVQSPGTVTQAGTPISAAALNKLEQGVADALPMAGGMMTGDLILGALVIEADARSLSITYDAVGNIITVLEKLGATTVKTETYTYNSDNSLATYTVVGAGKTVTSTYSYNSDGTIAGTTKTVV